MNKTIKIKKRKCQNYALQNAYKCYKNITKLVILTHPVQNVIDNSVVQ